MSSWDEIKRINSSDANVSKFVFTKGDAIAEAVLYKYPSYEARTVICCSTQAGCPVGCRFCGAGDQFIRSLTPDEIEDQPAHLIESTGVDPSKIARLQIMFMSMGEPMLNWKNLRWAISSIHQSYPQAALLISTSAPRVNYENLLGWSVAIPRIGLQFSIHESTDEARDRLIPFKEKLSLKEIAIEGERWHAATGRNPFFNYCVHDKNNTERDADRLREILDPAVFEATISVICERNESIAAANARQRKLAAEFQTKLMDRGYSTRMFDPAGQDDIGGGCGQLWFVQDWMKKHPEISRPSIGNGLPVLHAPGNSRPPSNLPHGGVVP